MKQELLERYERSLPESSRRKFASRARAFLTWLNNDEPDAEAVRRWLDKLRRDGYADGTIRHEFDILRRLFRVNNLEWPFRRGDAPVVREHQVRAPALAFEDIKAMVDVVLGRRQPQGDIQPDGRHRAFLCLSTVWGLRREEMHEMVPEFLDHQASLLFVQTAKHGRQRWHVVPDFLWPHLDAWSFQQSLSTSKLTVIFQQLKNMIGFTGDIAYEVGWHSIRRSAIDAAYEVGIPENQIDSFYRWKRSSSNMARRYGTSHVVGTRGVRQEMGLEDRKVDEIFYQKHPFVRFWRDDATQEA